MKRVGLRESGKYSETYSKTIQYIQETQQYACTGCFV